MTTTNPLLQKFSGFDQSVPFSQIKKEHYIPAIKASIDEARKHYEQIRNNTALPNFENTMLALESAGEHLEGIMQIFSNLEVANGDDDFHAMGKEIYPMVTAFNSEITLDEKIFSRIKSIYEQRQNLNLNPEQLRLVEKSYISFTRNGALLNEEQKDKLRKIDQELSTLGPQFSEHVLKATNAFEVFIENPKDIAGLPESALEMAAHLAESKGKKGQWYFNLQMPSFLPLMTYCQNRPLREKMWRAYNSRAYRSQWDNQEIILKTLNLKQDRAKLLGFKNHAEYALAERMAKNPESVEKFLHDLLAPSKNAAQKDFEEVKAFAERIDGLKDLMPWDMAYYSEKLKEEKYAFNEEDLRPYFQLEKVVEGVFTHAEKLYDIRFEETKDVEVYHPEVKAYKVFEKSTSKYMGLFYTDFFPRETKKGGAWMTSFRDQGLHDGKVMRPHISIVCNFTKPTPTKPSLLTYDEVRTLFHEFGHALHGMLSDCTYKSLAGTNVYWDFVELPSQIMENWVGEKEGLDIFAKHYQTHEPIPGDLVAKLKRSQQFQAGWTSLRQLNFGLLDMAWYTAEASLIKDVTQFELQATLETRLFPAIEGVNTSCAFSHIFAGGYSAGYYSYKWAEVLDADAFEYFKEKGLFNSEVAKKFKDNILSRGGTEHPMELYKKFRGREPDPSALLRRDGLI